MQLTSQSAIIAIISKSASHQLYGLRKVGVAISIDMQGAGISSGEERGPARCTDGTLSISAGEGHSFSDETIQVWGTNVLVAQGMDGVKPLLISTDPEDIWS